MGLLSKGQDVELIKRILDNNDRKAADELVSRYYKCVYKHIYIKLKDEEIGMDITQEIFIAALKGLGAPARLVILPLESHGYAAKESILHTLWEQDQWLEKYVKNRK